MFSQKRVFEIIEKGQADDRASRYCDLFLFSLIVLNLLAVCLETIDSLYAQYRTVFTLIELISVSIFSIEYALRIWSCAAAPDGKQKVRQPNALAIYSALRALLIYWQFYQALFRFFLAALICAGFAFCG